VLDVVLFSFIVFIAFFIVVIVSYCCTHVTSTIYYCIISVIVIYSYKVLLFLLYLACCDCMYVAIVSIQMCLLVNDKYKCCWIQNSMKSWHSSWLSMFHFHALKDYWNFLNTTNKCTRIKCV
jgi:hypothetical protein